MSFGMPEVCETSNYNGGGMRNHCDGGHSKLRPEKLFGCL